MTIWSCFVPNNQNLYSMPLTGSHITSFWDNFSVEKRTIQKRMSLSTIIHYYIFNKGHASSPQPSSHSKDHCPMHLTPVHYICTWHSHYSDTVDILANCTLTKSHLLRTTCHMISALVPSSVGFHCSTIVTLRCYISLQNTYKGVIRMSCMTSENTLMVTEFIGIIEELR